MHFDPLVLCVGASNADCDHANSRGGPESDHLSVVPRSFSFLLGLVFIRLSIEFLTYAIDRSDYFF
jgi:hypothetical protein